MTNRLVGIIRRLLAKQRHLREICTGPAIDRRDDAVSHWSVAQHLEHLALVNEKILGGLDQLDLAASATPQVGSPTILGRIVLLTGWIRRGLGNAPDGVRPDATDAKDLTKRVDAVIGRLTGLDPHLTAFARCKQTLPHPRLGDFTPGQWLRFVEIHDHHHWKIIRDIDRSRSR